MAGILDVLTQQFGGQVLESLSQQAGVDKGQAGNILGSVIPILMGALARNSSSPDGAEALHNALNKDHDGSILDDIGGYLQNTQAGNGAGILKHLLGDNRGNLENALSNQTGANSSAIGSILEASAPIILGLLGKQQKQGGLDAGGLSNILKSGMDQMNRQSPGMDGIIGEFLDKDGDGNIDAGVAQMGANLIGKFFN